MFWIKLLSRKSGSPLVLVHMSKPFAAGRAPAKDQTFILERDGNDWKDATSSVVPKGVDLTMHFRPQRSTNIIEVASWKQIQRADGRGLAYGFGERKLDLRWDGRTFQIRKPGSLKLSND